jgi:FAD synthetase
MDSTKTVMVFGTFDIVHLGHISFFHEAKKYGDELLVVVARDKRAAGIKGSAPIFSEKERVALLEELSVIDRVVLGDKTDVYRVIKNIKPDTIVLGYDQEIFTTELEKKIKEFGLEIDIVRAKSHKPELYKTQLIKYKLRGDV